MKAVKTIATIATLAAISTTASQAATGAQNFRDFGNFVYDGVTNNKVTEFVQTSYEEVTDHLAAQQRDRPKGKTGTTRRGGRHHRR